MEKSNCSYILAYSVLLLTFQMPFPAEASTSLATDQSALAALKARITSDPHRILTRNWTINLSSSACSWIGVTCGLRHRRVTALNISGMNLGGTIPPQLSNLSFLVSLDLGVNLFSGALPPELSLLHRLKFVSLRVNNFMGDIPSWFGLLPKLEHLSLRNNTFTGSIPNSLSNLSNLQLLDFSFNSLNGNIPQELGRLQNLKLLSIQYNHLSGVIPSSLFNMSNLENIGFTKNELSGSLPVDMCRNLPFLKGIYLSKNQLRGQIPSTISACSQLKVLSLSDNSFSGQIPAAVWNLKSLQTLYLGRNNLIGVIPPEIGNLQNLVGFGIERNQINGGLPPSIGNLTMLRILYLSENKLTGGLPREIGQLSRLQELTLHVNNLSGSIPGEFFNISTLQTLSLTDNALSGSLPTNIGYGSPALQLFLLDYNYLTGPIPDSLSNSSNLRILSLSSNSFTAFNPRFLGNLRLLERLQLFDNNLNIDSSSFFTSITNCRALNLLAISGNPINGIIPASIGNLSSSLQNFFAYNCKIKGAIPADIGNLSSLVKLSIYNNELTGNIPLTVKNMHKLQGLYLENNSLEGSIPKGLCDLQSLVEISLRRNQLSGPIPECLENLISLRQLRLDSNMLTSNIPSSLWRLKDLVELDLSSNSLSGFLPQEIGNLVAIVYMNLSMNQLSESIPSTIGNLQNLVNLSLAHNSLEGSIPVAVGNMISLVTLDLSYNSLTGAIPKSMEALQHLAYFNVSFNALSGEIPTGGPFRNFTMESFKANDALCGINVRLCPSVSNPKSKRKKVQLALFVLAGAAALITVASLSIIFARYRWKNKAASRIDGLVSPIPERISYYQIIHATEHFSESNLLGIGGFGSVYKGILRDGTAIAVKVFKMQSEAASKSFDVECEILRNIRHRNLTKVISSCSNEDFKALVLEYMPKGSLEKWLYSHNHFLDVVQRLNIMIDVASALEYLHHGYSTPIVHCDLKPSNVLLDEEMVAHVSDFGIAKLLGDEGSVELTSTLATLGYIAPEYGLEGLVSTKCDVYSYGVMLMETFARKRPSDDMFGGDLSLKSWVESSLQEVIDANLLVNLEKEELNRNRGSVSSVFELALKCCAEAPRDRINMKEALTQLLKIKSQFFQ